MELLLSFFHEKSVWELAAVALGLAYLILAMKESLWCWPAAFVSTAIYTWLFWHVSLLMDSALNIYYMAMALYGFWAWLGLRNKDQEPLASPIKQKTQQYKNQDTEKHDPDKHYPEKQSTPKNIPLQITSWALPQHLWVIFGVLTLSCISGYLLQENTEAAWPYVDSFTTWSSVLTTYMVTRKILENWLYWIVIDFVAMMLYIERGLYPTAMLFFVYLILCVFGFVAWKRYYQEQKGARVEGSAIA